MRTLFSIVILSIIFSYQLNAQQTKHWSQFQSIVSREVSAPADVMQQYEAVYREMVSLAVKYKSEYSSVKKFHKKFFEKFQEKYLEQYASNSSVSQLLNSGKFNCYSAALIYIAVMDEAGMTVQAYGTSDHVFLTYLDNDESFVLEVTKPAGGEEFETDINKVTDNLLEQKIITQRELKFKGSLGVYTEIYRNAHPVSFSELLGIQFMKIAAIECSANELRSAYNYSKIALDYLKNPASYSQYYSIAFLALGKYSNDTVLAGEVFNTSIAHFDSSNDCSEALSTAMKVLVDVYSEKQNFSAALAVLARVSVFSNNNTIRENYKIAKSKLVDSQLKECNNREDFDSYFSINRKFYLEDSTSEEAKKIYCINASYAIMHLAIKEDLESVIYYVDTLKKDLSGTSCLNSVAVGKLGEELVQRWITNETMESIETKLLSCREKYLIDKSNTSAKTLYICAARSKVLKLVRLYEWSKAQSYAKILSEEFPNDPAIQKDKSLIDEQIEINRKIYKTPDSSKKKK
ncbi:MAG: hypothetical protein LWX56_09490 [Ignavibacteria bacterium]|nr:hypothetical protein [Ignavibacteria bacterium]